MPRGFGFRRLAKALLLLLFLQHPLGGVAAAWAGSSEGWHAAQGTVASVGATAGSIAPERGAGHDCLAACLSGKGCVQGGQCCSPAQGGGLPQGAGTVPAYRPAAAGGLPRSPLSVPTKPPRSLLG